MNFVSIIALIVSTTLGYSAPLIFTALGGAYSEHAGVVNVGLEGIMTMGAFASVAFNLAMGQALGDLTPWIGLLVGGLVGILFAALHAVATINFRADHVVSGTVLNLMAPPLAVFLVKAIYDKGQTETIGHSFGYFNFPGLSSIPVLGPIFFKNTSGPAWLAIILSIFLWWIMYKTRFGLRLRSAGENPQAADTLGVNVYKMRYAGVLISGFLGGIGGAVFAQAISGNFSATTIAGQGFMAMAAMIFGKWNPLGAMGASLFFGFAQSLSIIGNQIPVLATIPPVYLQISPYVITVVVLVLFFGKAVGPAADGLNYVKSK